MSNEIRGQFLDCYDEHRVKNQLDWYRSRSDEYERADNRAVLIGEILVLGAAVCGIIGGFSSDARVALGITATALAAANVAVSQWGDLIGFKPNTDLYRAAEAALARLRPTRPAADAPDEQVRAYLQEVENVLLGEVTSWAQTWGSQATTREEPPIPGGAPMGSGSSKTEGGALTGHGDPKTGTGESAKAGTGE